MFNQLPNLFGKSFLIGYFLPSVLIYFSFIAVALTFEVREDIISLIRDKLLFGTSFSILIISIFSVFLLALNYPILRFLEGYGRLNPLKVLYPLQVRVYKKLKEKAHNNNLKSALRLTREFPPEAHLLPTRFGNSIRAFELYSSTVYGLDAIPAWNRLSAIIPKEYNQLLDEQKAQMDFWVNIWLGGCLIAITDLWVSFKLHQYPHWGDYFYINCCYPSLYTLGANNGRTVGGASNECI